jgi:hypothetical protein
MSLANVYKLIVDQFCAARTPRWYESDRPSIENKPRAVCHASNSILLEQLFHISLDLAK